MIDVEKLELGDIVESDGTVCNFPKGTKHKVVSATELGSYWVSEDSVAIDGFSYVEEHFTLTATSTKYSDIQEGDIVEIVLVDEAKLQVWPEMAKLIERQGEVFYKGKQIEVKFDKYISINMGVEGIYQCMFDAHELRVVDKECRSSYCECEENACGSGRVDKRKDEAERIQSCTDLCVSTSPLNKQVSGNHYKSCAIQPIKYIHANGLDYLQGNVIKYTTRHKDKNGKADIEKAIHYLELIIELQYKDK